MVDDSITVTEVESVCVGGGEINNKEGKNCDMVRK